MNETEQILFDGKSNVSTSECFQIGGKYGALKNLYFYVAEMTASPSTLENLNGPTYFIEGPESSAEYKNQMYDDKTATNRLDIFDERHQFSRSSSKSVSKEKFHVNAIFIAVVP